MYHKLPVVTTGNHHGMGNVFYFREYRFDVYYYFAPDTFVGFRTKDHSDKRPLVKRPPTKGHRTEGGYSLQKMQQSCGA